MKISKRTREQAALICALAASNAPHLFYPGEEALGLRPVGGMPNRAGWLARDAYAEISIGDPRPRHNAEICAEAEALLRTGWTPGRRMR